MCDCKTEAELVEALRQEFIENGFWNRDRDVT